MKAIILFTAALFLISSEASAGTMNCNDGPMRDSMVTAGGTTIYFISCDPVVRAAQVADAQKKEQAKREQLNPTGQYGTPPTQRPSSDPAQGRSGSPGGRLNPGRGAGCPDGRDVNGDPCSVK